MDSKVTKANSDEAATVVMSDELTDDDLEKVAGGFMDTEIGTINCEAGDQLSMASSVTVKLV